MATRHSPAQPLQGDSGQILVLTAVVMIVLLGIAALSLDVSHMYDKRNRLHAAADAAAKSAAIELHRNPGVTQAELEAFADQQVALHGFTPGRSLGCTTCVVVSKPPSVGSGPFAGSAGYVQVTISEVTSTFFAKILGRASMTPTAVAVAGAGNPSSCLIVLENLTFGNSEIHSNGCGVSVGGNLIPSNPGSEIDGTPDPSVGVTGTCTPEGNGNCALMGVLTQGAPPPVDPLAGLALPVNPGGCVPGTAATLNPGCYTSISSSVTTLTAGIYYVTGKIDVGNLTGTNVMLFLAPGGQLTGDNNKIITITAPTTGTYKGVAIFQDPSNLNDIDIKNAFTFAVTGALYFPGAPITFKNHFIIAPTSCTLFIGRTLNFDNGNGQLNGSGCAAMFGGAAYLTVSIAQ